MYSMFTCFQRAIKMLSEQAVEEENYLLRKKEEKRVATGFEVERWFSLLFIRPSSAPTYYPFILFPSFAAELYHLQKI